MGSNFGVKRCDFLEVGDFLFDHTTQIVFHQIAEFVQMVGCKRIGRPVSVYIANLFFP